ncbi:hypothetical protein [Succinimonas amylolytica]|uniref:hypothetical protein n=1 Tax=Succinimonas amylolytica TaxID=83769 RepID=UPI0023A8F2AD
MIEADTSGAEALAEKLKGLPGKLQTRISRVIMKEALKETGAREELTGYISSHFKTHTGIYRKSVSGIKSARVRTDPNRIISYIHFLPVSKVKGGKEGKKPHMPPKTLNHWLNSGTRDHAIGKGSSLEGNKVIRQLIANKYQIAINRARLNLASAKTQKQRERYQAMLERNTKKLAEAKTKAAKKASQHGRKVKGITARHFMEAIQRKVDQNAVAIVVQQAETAVAELLK